MSILKVIEILTSSEKGWEDAAQKAVTHASKTVKNIRSVYVNEQSAVVENNKIVTYRVNAKITFEVN
jgi:flavin-binding protein dodecin